MTALEDLFDAPSLAGMLVNMYNLLQSITYDMFILIFLPLPFLSIWIVSKKVIIPSILYMTIGSAVAIIAPWELKKPAMLMLGFGLSGIIANWFLKNR